MRRFPLGATLATLVMMACLIGLGVWQLQRREWKHDLIARLEAAQHLPPLEPHDYLAAMRGQASVQYRRAVLPCAPGRVRPYDIKGGTSAAGDGGYLILVNCSPSQRPPDIVAVAGWAQRPDAAYTPIAVDTDFTGTIIEHPYGDTPGRPMFMLIASNPVAPLGRPRLPTPDDLPDNHLSYAVQWFGLAAALAGVYLVWLLRRRPR